MRFKIIGLVFLLIGMYLAVDSFIVAERSADASLMARVYPLLAIFLALVVRVLQAEKHHRDVHKEPEEENAPAEETDSSKERVTF